MKRFFVVLVVPLALFAAGCGTEPNSFEGSDDALRDASTSRMEWRFEGTGAPDWGVWRLSGLIDYANNRGEMVINGKSDSAPAARAQAFGSRTSNPATPAATPISGPTSTARCIGRKT